MITIQQKGVFLLSTTLLRLSFLSSVIGFQTTKVQALQSRTNQRRNTQPTIRSSSSDKKEQDDDDDYDDDTWLSVDDSSESIVDVNRRDLIYNSIGVALLGVSGVASFSLFQTNVYTPPGFARIPTQFIAALGDPKASTGRNAKEWGVWRRDPGPRGVWLSDFQKELAITQKAPAGWTFDPNDWWLEEHGLIMEQPTFPLPAGRYLVTGGRLVTTGLTIYEDGRWKLDEGTLYDVTHLPCRSARYTPQENSPTNSIGSPLSANPKDFPVIPGAIMPSVPGCNKQDYAVLFVVGKEKTKDGNMT